MRVVFCLFLAACTLWSSSVHSQDNGCGPLPLGSPCATGGLATAGATSPSTNFAAGNPINWLSGNKYLQHTDLPAHANHPGIELVRHYNSQDTRSGVLGQGWTFSYDTRVVQAGGRWQIVQADGSNIVWNRLSATSASGPYGTLLRNSHGWRWHWPNGHTLWFDSQGLLQHMSLPQGHTLRIMRDGLGRLHRVENSSGSWLQFHYFPRPAGAEERTTQVYTSVQVTTPRGVFRYGADTPPPADSTQSGKQNTLERANSRAAQPLRLRYVQRPDGMQRHYHYEEQHQAGQPYAITGESLVSADGLHRLRRSTWRYDPAGRAVAWHARHSTDTGKAAVRVRYTPSHPSEPEPGAPGLANKDSHLTGPTRTLHATNGQGVKLTLGNGPSGAARVRRIETRTCEGCPQGGWPQLRLNYAPNGQLQTWFSALTGSEQWHYDEHGRIKARTLADGTHTLLAYNAGGQLIRATNHNTSNSDTTRVHWQGAQPRSVHHTNETQHMLRDAAGRVIERVVQRPDARARGGTLVWRERYHWTHHGKLKHHWLAEGGRLDYSWSPDGRRLLGVIWQDAAGQRHPVINSVAGVPGYRYGNGLHLRTRLNAQGRAHQLVLQKPDHAPLWAARLGYTHTGLVASEHHVYQPNANGQNNKHGRAATLPRHTSLWSYAYNQNKQLVGARKEPAFQQDHPAATRHHAHQTLRTAQTTGPGHTPVSYWYAWHDDGSLAAVHHQNQTTRPDIPRNPTGLPQRVENYTVNYGPNRRLTQISRNKQVLVSYLHNAYGHRIVASTEQEQTHYLYLNQQVVAERRVNLQAHGSAQTPAPLVTRRYVYAGITPIGLIDYQQNNQGSLFAVHADFTGAPRVLTDQQGQIRWLADYSPTGKATKVLGDMTLWLRLPGQMEDPVTGWHDNLLRTYLPEQGQYLEPDPLGPVPGQQALGYAAQQPRRHVDPTGLILFAFDGTRQDASTGGNVWKLSQAYRDGPTYYHRGPGNSQELDWNALTAADAQQILTTQWQHLLNEIEKYNNRPTPLSIDIVGFSRGAALAREFANRIHQQSPGGYFSVNDSVRGTLNACVDLRFMGLFDTVAQFGMAGSQNDQYNLSIAPVWTWVAHAVALHERRWLFPLSTAYDSAAHNVIEAPFIGAHADIGGGQLSSGEQLGHATPAGDLANVALAWMAWQARAAGLVFDLPGNQRASANPLLHDERSALMRQLQNGDRSILDSNSRLLHTYQQEHARLGEQPRQQTEPIIEREHDWLASADNIVGTIDMNAYARWLRDTLGWGALPA